MRFASLISGRQNPSAPALIAGDRTFSYRDVQRESQALSERLRAAGLGPGAKLLTSLPNSPEFLLSLFAVDACDAVFLPVSPNLTPSERSRIEALARPDFVLGTSGDMEVLPRLFLSRCGWDPYGDEDLSNISTIIFTSGTTGAPKGVMMSADALLKNASAVRQYLELESDDRTLIFLPLHYTYSLSQVLSTLIGGGSIVLLPNLLYPVRAVSIMAEHRVTGFGGVPTSLNILASHPGARDPGCESIRYILSAGGPLSPVLTRQLQQAFPKARVLNNYGCTEIGPRATSIDYSRFEHKIGSIGRPIENVAVTIVQPDLSLADPGQTGEIVLNGASLMKGYYRDPQGTAARMSSRGFHTGDYGYADADGFLYYEGRRDDIFKSAGEKVSAKEIEDVLLEHDGVLEAAVVAESDPLLGDAAVAYVVLRDTGACTDRDLQAFCARRLSRHKVPRRIRLVPELHKTASGKIQKFLLKEAYQ